MSENENMKTTDNSDSPDFTLSTVLGVLRDYPHIQSAVLSKWKYKWQLAWYIKDLLHDTRENTRLGFPLEITNYLILLYNHLHPELPEEKPFYYG